jgi:hypothetical protein
LSARYLRIAELSVSRKSPSSSTGTRRFGLTAWNGGCVCSPVNRSTTFISSAIPLSAANSITVRLVVEAGW